MPNNFRPNNEPKHGTEAKLRLEYIKNGHHYVAEGLVVDPEFRQWIEESNLLYRGQRYYLTFKPEADGTYIKVKRTEIIMEIRRTAEVEIDDLTVEKLAAACKAAGCPANAQFNIYRNGGMLESAVGQKIPATVTFRWTENGPS